MSESTARRLDPEVPDEELMIRIAAGRASALQSLMDRHWGGLVTYGSRMVGCPDAARDIAQEVFVRVWKHRERWIPGGSPRAYLYQVARNLVLVRRRHLEVRERTEPEVRARAPRSRDPLEDLVGTELEQAIDEAIDALPDRRREALLLVRFHGLSLREAAESMGVRRRTVANHVYMAARQLEKALGSFLG